MTTLRRLLRWTPAGLFGGIGAEDAEMREFLEHWVDLRRRDGTMQEYHDHWIIGKAPARKSARWSVIREIFGNTVRQLPAS